jgi:hypothetical protein
MAVTIAIMGVPARTAVPAMAATAVMEVPATAVRQ